MFFLLLLSVLAALSRINEAIDSGDPNAILQGLQHPSAKLNNVRPKNAELYAIILREAKAEKAKVRKLLVSIVSTLNTSFIV